MEAEHTFGDVRNEGLAAYFRKEVEQIECHEKQLNQQLEDLIQKNDTPGREFIAPESAGRLNN